MHYQPTDTELAHLQVMSSSERIEYFLTRAIECEEIWGHADSEGWVLREDGVKSILPVWSYQNLANASLDRADLHVQATSLEHFIDILSRREEGIFLEILPAPGQAGALISASELLGMFESLMDAGTYFLEG